MCTLTPTAALEFTSLPMLGWLAAAALPWLIHRWSRQQHRTTSWAAVELLLSAMQKQARKVQLQQWLLLAIRTAILLLVALAAAEPILRQWALGADESSTMHRIFVLDRSYSMGCEQFTGSRWQLAQDAARTWIENSEGDPLTVIGWARQAENFAGRPTLDSSVALSAVEQLRLADSSADLSAAFPAIQAAITRAEKEFPQVDAHQVVFFTDLGRRTWSMEAKQRDLWNAMNQLASIKLVNVAEGSADNVAVTDLTVEPALTLRQRQTSISATISCFGQAKFEDVQTELWIEGRRIAQQKIDLQENGVATVRFKHRFLNEGPQTVQLALTNHQDVLPSDDQRWLIAKVQPRLRVACFAGHAGAADDLARALAPGANSAEQQGNIKPEVFPAIRLAEVELSAYSAVVLASPGELSPRETATLTEYVRQGGSLALFLGRESDSALNHDIEALSPVSIGAVSPVGDYRFDPLQYGHPVVAPFRGQSQSGLLGVSISQYFALLLNTNRLNAEVVLNFSTGNPALVVDQYGLGRVAVSALPGALVARTSTGIPWSSLALSPSFLPVVRELVDYLVSDRWLQHRNLAVGETAIFFPPAAATTASVRLPEGTSQLLALPAVEDDGQFTYQDTNQRGIYRFYADEKECARFAVNLDGFDSDLMGIDSAELPTGLSVESNRLSRKLSDGLGETSLVRILLASAVGLLLFEIGLAWMLGRGWG